MLQKSYIEFLLEKKENDLLELGTDLAAILEERDPMPRETGIDINERIIALRNQRKNNNLSRGFVKIKKINQHEF